MTLYLKYRPQKICELDIAQVREVISKLALTKDKPHAFLFSGPKGTGKTSAARILAKVINCENLLSSGEPCNKCEQCLAISRGNSLDVLEMDAASNRGIDDIRALREKVILAPNTAKKKVYIIDEVHMLTTEAANAFLKTLEEPPGHVVFILATTDPQKLPSTVRSRLTNVVFSRASESEIKRQLRRVAKGEKLNVEDGVFELISEKSGGSFRDAVKNLEVLIDGRKKITLERAREVLSGGGDCSNELISCIDAGELKKSLDVVERYVAGGGDIGVLVGELVDIYHEKLLVDSEIYWVLEILIEANEKIKLSPLPEIPLEIALVKIINREHGGDRKKEEEKVEMEVEENVGGEAKMTIMVDDDIQACVTKQAWERVVEIIKEKNFSVDALLRTARPLNFDGNNLSLGVYYQFHKEKLEDVKNRTLLETVLTETFGFPVRISCSVTEKPETKEVKEKVVLTDTSDADIIRVAEEIFSK